MANRTRYFFFAPTWDYPQDGPIKIGNILTKTHLKSPEKPICNVSPSLEMLLGSEKQQVEFTLDKLRQGHFTIFTRFLSFLGVGVDIGTSWDLR